MEHLIDGAQPVLADRLQQVKKIVAVIQELIMKIEQQPSPLRNGSSSPLSLCSVGQLSADLDIGRSGGRELAYHAPREG
jgi:hypothetical protein